MIPGSSSRFASTELLRYRSIIFLNSFDSDCWCFWVQDVYNNEAETPLNIAEKNENKDIIELLSPDVIRMVSIVPGGNHSPSTPDTTVLFDIMFCAIILNAK